VNADAVGPTLGTAVGGIDELLADEVLEIETVALARALLPGCGAQVAHRNLTLAIVELGDLAEAQRIAFAGVARKIVDDAAADSGDGLAAARLGKFEVIDRAMGGKRQGLG